MSPRTITPISQWSIRRCAWLLVALCLAACGSNDSEHDRHMKRATAMVERDDLERARVEVLNALRLQPDSVDASLLGATIAVEQGEWRLAARLFSNVLDQAPQHVEALVGLARIHVLAGQPGDALALTSRALQVVPEHIGALTTHASALAHRDAHSSAMVHVNTALRLAPDDEEAVVLLAYLLERSGQGDAAIESLRRGIERNPSSERLITGLGELALALGDINAAVDAQRMLIERDPSDSGAHHRLARLLLHDQRYADAQRALRRVLETNPDDLVARLFLTESYRRSGDYATARQTLSSFLTDREDVPELRLLLANLYEHEGQAEAAVSLYRASASDKKSEAVTLAARNNIARILIGRGEYEAARTLIDEVLSQNASDVEALTLSGFLSLRRGAARRAIADLRAAHEGGGEGFVTVLLAEALRQTSDPASAIALLRERTDAPHAEALLARLLFETADYDGAARHVAALLTRDPYLVPARELDVELALRDARYEAAALAAQSIIDVTGDEPLGYHLAARVARARGQINSAEQYARQALELSPGAVEPLELVVTLLLDQERLADARRLLEQVVTARPAHAIALWWLGRVILQAGDPSAAAALFERASAARPQWSRPWLWRARVALATDGQGPYRHWLMRGASATGGAADLTARLAELDVEAGDVAMAIERYRSLLLERPQAPELLNNLAMLLLNAQRDDRDLTEARALVERLPATEDPRLHDTIGQVMARTCSWLRAERSFRRALTAQPDHPAYRLRLAQALLGQARHAEARTQLAALDVAALSDDLRQQFDDLTTTSATADASLPCVSLEPENPL